MPKLGPMGREMTMVCLATSDRFRTFERLRDRLAEQIDVVESSRDLCSAGAAAGRCHEGDRRHAAVDAGE